jgi:hypothetical protein
MFRYSLVTQWYVLLSFGALFTITCVYAPLIIPFPRLSDGGGGVFFYGLGVFCLSLLSLPLAFLRSSPFRGERRGYERLIGGFAFSVLIIYCSWVGYTLFALSRSTDL